MKRNFMALLRARWKEGKFACVGLDLDLSKVPGCVKMGSVEDTLVEFSRAIIRATQDLVCAYKPNIAFFEAYGAEGFAALQRVIMYINTNASDVPVILDAKRADIGNTNAGYVTAAFKHLGADAITLQPYLGAEALEPFLTEADKGCIVLCRTSNQGAGEFQDKMISLVPGHNMPLYQYVARQVATDWNKNGNCLLVVGATYPEELQQVRRIVGDMPILIPGIGAQGGDTERTVLAGMDSRGEGMIINSSRGIIYASSGADFAEAARIETLKLHKLINQYRK